MLWPRLKVVIKRPLNTNATHNSPSVLWDTEFDYYSERDRWDYDDAIYYKWGKEGMSLAETSMANLVGLCNNHNIKISLVIYPWPGHLKRRGTRSRYADMWKKFGKRNSVEVIDLMNVLDHEINPEAALEKYYIVGDCHFSEEGHKVVADHLQQWIEGQIKR